MPELHWSTSTSALTAAEALEAFVRISEAPRNETSAPIGLLYSPRKCRFARLIEGAPQDEFNAAIELVDVFELRFFNGATELRWRQESSGKGRAVILGESPLTIEGWTSDSKKLLESDEVPADARNPGTPHLLRQKYFLWGTGLSSQADRGRPVASGWSRLTEARIGVLAVPMPSVPEGERVVLNAVEYLADGDDDGNVVVIEQRCVGLAIDSLGLGAER
jgi:CRISPR-associated protein (TIGR03984 family)